MENPVIRLWHLCALAGLLVFLASCQLVEQLDPAHCPEGEALPTLSIGELRVSQTNQLHDNSIPLLADRAAGVRAVAQADVEKGVKQAMIMRLEHVTADGARTELATKEFDCIRASNALTHRLEPGALQAGDSVEVTVEDGAGTSLATAVAAPRLVSGEYYTLVFVPLQVNGDLPPFDEGMAEVMAGLAHEMFPTQQVPVFREPLDLGSIAQSGRDRAYEAYYRLREQVTVWADNAEIPEFAAVIGVLPKEPGGSWGVGGGGAGVTSTSTDMFLHELGHALGAPHAHGCGAPGALEGSTTAVSPLGYNHVSNRWVGGNDVMSYCHPRDWMGAPLFEQVMRRFEWNNTHGPLVRTLTLGHD